MSKSVMVNLSKNVVIKDCGSLWGFEVGDIVTQDDLGGIWFNQRVEVEGFKNGALWGIIRGEIKPLDSNSPPGLIMIAENRKSNQWTKSQSQEFPTPTGLMLLERQSFPFRVGDTVTGDGDREGKVVVLNPYNVGVEQVLVEFPDGKKGLGRRMRMYCDYPWYSEKYNKDLTHLFWVNVNKLKVQK